MSKTKNKIGDLRDHLFETLELLKDPDKPLDCDRAKAICAVADKIIDTARVEVKYAEVVGALPDYEFFQAPGADGRKALPEGNRPNGKA